MIKKCFVFLGLVAAIAVAAYAPPRTYLDYYAANGTNKSHHLIAGSRLPGDRLFFQENIVKSSSWLQIVTLEKSYGVGYFNHITQVQALDQKINGNGAYATIVKGGPGTSNVTIRFKSQRSHGINFRVLIFAR
ncbi:probable salivary secreted peptide [Microplitis demolitor]|uniref:probable salivary secreted peptide n=1 Tax=Microplitis demolitor TaxID=69319 RepID=UPI0004CD33AF|nr:probable salivary secreted peptide [Microplitis demolitor]